MGQPVTVSLKTTAEKVSTVMDDELHQLVLEGQVSLKDAINSLKNAGIALDKRFYSWLHLAENTATGEFDKLTEAKPEAKPDLLSPEAEAKITAEPDPVPGPANPAPEGAK